MEGEGKCLKIPVVHFAEDAKVLVGSRELEGWCVGEHKADEHQRISLWPTTSFPTEATAFSQPGMCVVFGYFWHVEWGWEHATGSKGDG